jgi:hypothetical protein
VVIATKFGFHFDANGKQALGVTNPAAYAGLLVPKLSSMTPA